MSILFLAGGHVFECPAAGVHLTAANHLLAKQCRWIAIVSSPPRFGAWENLAFVAWIGVASIIFPWLRKPNLRKAF